MSATPTPCVAIVPCQSYGPELKAAYEKCFHLLGGLRSKVQGKTVSIKINLTMEGQRFKPLIGRAPGLTYQTHELTVTALTAQLFSAGARRVRIIESMRFRAPLAEVLVQAGWDVNALLALGAVEFENTRNKGRSVRYSRLMVPGGGLLFSFFEVNPAYIDTDFMISLAKLKEHGTTGVTLSMKNMFGMTPNSLYGDDAPSEDAIGGRSAMHGFSHRGPDSLPGAIFRRSDIPRGMGIPHIITDLCKARPVDLAIIDGITSVSGGEGFWSLAQMRFTKPGVLIAGFNPVSTDVVGTAVMGFSNPRGARGTPPFEQCENFLLLAEKAGLGRADLSQIEVRGQSLEESIYPYS